MSRRNKHIATYFFGALLVGFALLSATPARAYLPPKFGGAITVAVPDRIPRMDPTLLTQDYEIMISGCIFDTLVAPGPGGGFVPVLLEVLPEKSDDGMTYYFKLREGVKFHDGSIMNSAAVLNTFKHLMKNRRSPYTWLLNDIDGAEEYRADKLPTINGFKMTDALRFEIRLKQPQPNFVKYLCFPALSMISMADRDFRPPVGTGPFKYRESRPGGIVVLAANKEYFRGRPYVDSLVFRLIADERDRLTEFKLETVDVTGTPEGGLSRSEDAIFGPAVQSPLKRLYYIDVNTTAPALFLPGQRMALSKMIDRDGIVRVILNGNGDTENNVPGVGDPVALRKSASAGPDMVMWYPERSPALKMVAKKLQQDFGRTGVKIKLDGRPDPYMQDYSSDSAPAFILRSLPIFMGLTESGEKPEFAAGASALTAAMARRIGSYRDEKTRTPIGAAIGLFSLHPSYIRQKHTQGVSIGQFGAPDFFSAYIREPEKPGQKEPAAQKEEKAKKYEKDIKYKKPAGNVRESKKIKK